MERRTVAFPAADSGLSDKFQYETARGYVSLFVLGCQGGPSPWFLERCPPQGRMVLGGLFFQSRETRASLEPLRHDSIPNTDSKAKIQKDDYEFVADYLISLRMTRDNKAFSVVPTGAQDEDLGPLLFCYVVAGDEKSLRVVADDKYIASVFLFLSLQ